MCCIQFCSTAIAQTIPGSRQTDWTLAGYNGNKDVDYVVINFQDRGGIADGVTPNDITYTDILDSLAGAPAVIFFPSGNYFFNSTINLRSNLVIRGSVAGTSTLTFDLDGEDDLILARGSQTGIQSNLIADPAQNDTWIRIANPELFTPGDYVLFIEEDDSLITSAWALHTSGQITVVASVSNDTIYLKSPLRRAYQISKNTRIVKLLPVKEIGIENLKVVRLDATPAQTSNIKLEVAAECWINCVESYKSNFCHIDLRKCTNVDVEGCYMQDAFAYGGGGQGYGVVLHSTTGECLVTDNRFKHLRHSMLLQSGANGNVVSYNYSENPHWDRCFSIAG